MPALASSRLSFSTMMSPMPSRLRLHTWTIPQSTLRESCSSILFAISIWFSNIPYWDSAIMMTTLQVNIEHFSCFVTSEDVRTLDAFKRKTSLVDLLQWEPCQPVRRSTFLTSSSRHIFKHASLPGVRYRIYSVASQTRPSHCAQRRIVTQHVSF